MNSVCGICEGYSFEQRICDKCILQCGKRCLTEFEKFVNKYGHEDWDFEGMWEREQARIRKKDKIRKKVFITIALEGGSSKYDIKKSDLITFVNRIKYLYEDFNGVLEVGKHKSRPNYHIHYLARIINPKKHKGILNREWEKIFGNIPLTEKSGNYCINQHNDGKDMPPYNQWVDEKLLYLMNEHKGDHRNFDKSIIL